MDGITLCATVKELNSLLQGAKIEKVYQSSRDELVLHMRNGHKLLLCANAENCRVQLTHASRKNPTEPPMFCMLLRKHIGAGRILQFTQAGMDRTVHIDIEAADEMGFACTFTLIIEIMGRHSNIILCKQDGSIVDSLKHITPAISSFRVLMPGVTYAPPPAQDKMNPVDATQAEVGDALSLPLRADKAIMNRFSGVSPFMAKEIVRYAMGDFSYDQLDFAGKTLAIRKVCDYFDNLKNARFTPTLIVNEFNEPLEYMAFASAQYDQAFQQHYESMSEVLDRYYALRDTLLLMRQRGSALQKILHNNIERCAKKLALQNDLLVQEEKMEQYRLCGELISANLFRLQKGAKTAVVENYYDADMAQITIALDESLSPGDNAQRYYKKYNKAKTAAALATQQIIAGQKELDYLEGQLDNLSKCTLDTELAEIREELIVQGYVRPEKGRKRPPKLTATAPLHFTSSDGATILVGKNNAQNDRLTMKTADADDTWLHTKNIPGSHVIIKGTVTDATLREAAHLAVNYSKAKNGSQVPVDYTLRRFIKKPGGSPPGYVIYSTNKTLYITPDEALLKGIKQV